MKLLWLINSGIWIIATAFEAYNGQWDDAREMLMVSLLCLILAN